MQGNNKTLIAGLFGNALEWYDFSLYAYFSSIIASLFFPAQHEFVSLLATFGIFASGFLVRPIGSLLFGPYGDRLGHRKAMILSILS